VPEVVISRPTIRAFNWIYLHSRWRNIATHLMPFESFFYPLDRIRDWNRLYGQRGFLQYQFVVPYEKREAVRDILNLIVKHRGACALSVLKVFGSIHSPGLLSFPRSGVTLALDFPFQGSSTLDLCERFDDVVKQNGGAVYPAKDARMSEESFQTYFPRWREFSNFLDPHFSSNFWRRVASAPNGGQ